jgi:hypothetical protein
MKRILSIVLSLFLILGLIGCAIEPATETTPTTVGTVAIESSTTDLEIITGEEFEARYGISISYLFDFEEQAFIIELTWTNKFDYATSFHGNYLIDVYQKDIKLSNSRTSSYDIDAIHRELGPGGTLVVNLVYDLIDINEPVYLVISDMETEFHYDPFYPDAVG